MKSIKTIIGLLILLQVSTVFGQNKDTGAATPFTDKPVVLTVDLAKETGPMYPAWAWFGYDEPNYTYMKDGKNCCLKFQH